MADSGRGRQEHPSLRDARRDSWWRKRFRSAAVGGFGFIDLSRVRSSFISGTYLAILFAMIDEHHRWWKCRRIPDLGWTTRLSSHCYYTGKHTIARFSRTRRLRVREWKRNYKGETKFPFILQICIAISCISRAVPGFPVEGRVSSVHFDANLGWCGTLILWSILFC